MPSDFHRFEFRRSKKRRICCLCSKVIPKGQEYYSSATREGGVFVARATCIACGAGMEQERKEKRVENSEPSTSQRYMIF